MKRSTLDALPREAATLAVVVVFFSNADLYLTNTGRLPVAGFYLFLGALGALGLAVLAGAVLSPGLRASLGGLYASGRPVAVPMLVLAMVTLAAGFLPGARWDEGAKYVLRPFYGLAVLLLSMLLPFGRGRAERFRGYALLALGALAASVIADVLSPGTFSRFSGRAAGFAENPNSAAVALVALCAMAIRCDRVRARDVAALAATAVMVVCTLSRGGLILLGLLLAQYLAFALDFRRLRLRRVAAVLAAVCILGVLVARGVQVAAGSRLFSVASQARLDMLLGRQALVSGEDLRYTALTTSLDLVQRRPFLGHGTGFTFGMEPLGPHNMYLRQLLDAGIPGLLAYVWLLAAALVLFWRRRDRSGTAFVSVMAVAGLFSHNLLEDRLFLAGLGVFVALARDVAAEHAASGIPHGAPDAAQRPRGGPPRRGPYRRLPRYS